MSRLLDFATYPAVILGAIATFIALAFILPVTVASFIAVACGAVVIIFAERYRPYREQWQPDRRMVFNDAAFLTVVQVALPLLLSLPATIWVSNRVNPSGFQTIWPHDIPIVAQVVVIVTVSDFFRYWIHRAAHKWGHLWQFHAVHHSPKKLYWLNVGRFHPLEKAVQMLADSLPFALLAVNEQALAGYFVFYAINGFFQHSNCRVQLSFLNHIFAGPELHRWHHSRTIVESDRNFGNNLILWDALFGTRFLPADTEVGDLGLLNPSYPDGFVSQLGTPFQFGLEKASFAKTNNHQADTT